MQRVENEHVLIESIRISDTGAFKQLCQAYYDPLFHFLWRRTRDQEAAKSLVKRLFIDIWMQRRSLRISRTLNAFIYQRANQLALHYLKVNEQVPAADFSGEQANFREYVYEALQGLPESHRFAFILCRYERLSFDEIGQIMETSPGTVEKYIANSVKYLRDKLSHLLVT